MFIYRFLFLSIYLSFSLLFIYLRFIFLSLLSVPGFPKHSQVPTVWPPQARRAPRALGCG